MTFHSVTELHQFFSVIGPPGVRNQYVNISNTTPVSAPQSLFSVTPGSTAASPSAGATAAQLLLPGPGKAGSG